VGWFSAHDDGVGPSNAPSGSSGTDATDEDSKDNVLFEILAFRYVKSIKFKYFLPFQLYFAKYKFWNGRCGWENRRPYRNPPPHPHTPHTV
jgi:hypothetical protein